MSFLSAQPHLNIGPDDLVIFIADVFVVEVKINCCEKAKRTGKANT